jgi:YesN/AraC family two-component response regulator
MILLISEQPTSEVVEQLSSDRTPVSTCMPSSAVETLSLTPFDVVLLDAGYHIRRGLALLKDIKQTRQDVPVIFLTDAGSEDIAVEAFRLGARNYYRKPPDLEQLRSNIGHLLRLKGVAREKRTPYFFEPEAARAQSELRADGVPPGILRSLRYLRDNVTDDVSLSTLAAQANISKYHFSRLFKKHLGVGPKQCVIRMRVERSKELLESCDLNISLVAAEVGFNDVSNFIRQFKKLVGSTPVQYRRTASSK